MFRIECRDAARTEAAHLSDAKTQIVVQPEGDGAELAQDFLDVLIFVVQHGRRARAQAPPFCDLSVGTHHPGVVRERIRLGGIVDACRLRRSRLADIVIVVDRGQSLLERERHPRRLDGRTVHGKGPQVLAAELEFAERLSATIPEIVERALVLRMHGTRLAKELRLVVRTPRQTEDDERILPRQSCQYDTRQSYQKNHL